MRVCLGTGSFSRRLVDLVLPAYSFIRWCFRRGVAVAVGAADGVDWFEGLLVATGPTVMRFDTSLWLRSLFFCWYTLGSVTDPLSTKPFSLEVLDYYVRSLRRFCFMFLRCLFRGASWQALNGLNHPLLGDGRAFSHPRRSRVLCWVLGLEKPQREIGWIACLCQSHPSQLNIYIDILSFAELQRTVIRRTTFSSDDF